jgi:hypothetical protein
MGVADDEEKKWGHVTHVPLRIPLYFEHILDQCDEYVPPSHNSRPARPHGQVAWRVCRH